MKGFFSESIWNSQKQPLALLPECGRCGLYKTCITPFMPVSGKGRKRVLIIAEAPGENEDERGIQLIGNSGMKLVQLLHRIGVNMRKDCWLTNALICRPPKNAEPNNKQIDFCRPNLARTIEDLQPDVIIPLGKTAIRSLMTLAWKSGEVDDVASWAGWVIPCQQLNAWICPTYHPSFLLQSDIQATAEMFVTRHLKAAFALEGKPYPNGIPDYKPQCRIIYNDEEAAHEIRMMAIFNQPMAIDIETTTLKPDGPHAEILCCSVSDGKDSICYPWRGEAIEQTKRFLLSNVPKVVANLRFESRWFMKFLRVFPRQWLHDTLLGAHVLKCTHGITSLKFQAFVLFGIPDYDRLVEPYKKSKGGSNSPNRMKELAKLDFGTMGLYCALDSLFEVMVAKRQQQQGAILTTMN